MEQDLRDWVILIVGPWRYLGRPTESEWEAPVAGRPITLSPCFELYTSTHPLMANQPSGPRISGILREPFLLDMIGIPGCLPGSTPVEFVPNGVIHLNNAPQKAIVVYKSMIDALMEGAARAATIEQQLTSLDRPIGR